MSIGRVTCKDGTTYTPTKDQDGFFFKGKPYYHLTWAGLILYFKKNSDSGPVFIACEPINKEYWL